MKHLITLVSVFYCDQTGLFHFMVNGMSVCEIGFIVFYGISSYRLRIVMDHVIHGTTPVHGNSFRSYESELSDLVECWLHKYCKNYGDHQPDTSEVHLPANILKNEMYDVFIDDMRLLFNDYPSYSLFLHVWRTKFPFLKIPSAIRMGKCDICEKYDKLIADEKNGVKKRKYLDLRRIHHAKFKAERDWLTQLAFLAAETPSLMQFVCMDYMNPLRLPHFAELPKSCFTKQRVKFEVFGLIDHSFSTRSYATHFQHWSHDPNLNLSLLFSYLRKCRMAGKLSDKLILNTDNCFRDNKNKYTFAFLIMLIHYGWFSSVEFHLLMPGHSHYCVDRDCFACIGRKKWAANCPHPEHFWDKFLPSCFTSPSVIPPTKLDIDAVWDWKTFFSPHIGNVSGYAHVRSFKFTKNSSNSVTMHYKHDMLEPIWKGVAEDIGFTLLDSVPTGFPSVIPPSPLDPTVFKDIPHFQRWLNEKEYNWWVHFQNNQYPDDAFCASFDDFWLVEPRLVEQFDIDPVELDLPTNPIIMPDHGLVHVDQLLINTFVVLSFDNRDYSLAKVINTINGIKLNLFDFDDKSLSLTPTKLFMTVSLEHIFFWNIKPTKQMKLDKRKFAKIVKKFNK
jgi:hypothetical protein